VAEEFNVNIRTAQRYLLYLSDLPCVVTDEEKHTYTLTSDYVITDKILNTSEMALVCALIDYATHIFGTEHSKFLAGLKNRIFRMPDVYQIVKDEAIDMEKVAAVQLAAERHIKAREVISSYTGGPESGTPWSRARSSTAVASGTSWRCTTGS
jgi:hypothetical protein